MSDAQKRERVSRGLARVSGELRGMASTGVALLFCSAGVHPLISEGSAWTDTPVAGTCLIATLLLLCIIGSYRQVRIKWIFIWTIISLACAILMFLQSSWGDTLFDGGRRMEIWYHASSFASDYLFSAGSVILLISGSMLLVAESKAEHLYSSH